MPLRDRPVPFRRRADRLVCAARPVPRTVSGTARSVALSALLVSALCQARTLEPGRWYLLAPAGASTPADLSTAEPSDYGETWIVYTYDDAYESLAIDDPLDQDSGLWFISREPVNLVERGSDDVPADPVDRHTLVWSENFEELSVGGWDYTPGGSGGYRLGGERWISHVPGSFEDGTFRSADFGDNVFSDLSDGHLEIVSAEGSEDGSALAITATKMENGVWRSGLLSAVDSYRDASVSIDLGYVEWRLDLPAGPGLWPAAWMLPVRESPEGWGAEIDVLEHYGHDPDTVHHVLHSWNSDIAPIGATTDVPDILDGWHTVGVELLPEAYVYYIDRVEVWRTPRPEYQREMDFSPLVNLALGPGWPIDRTPDPSVLLVDYVRVYEPTP